MTDDYHQILSIAQNTRKIFEEMLDHSIGSATTKGTCLYAAFLCAEVIRKFSGFPTRIRGGDGEFKKGINIQGSCHGHYWTEVSVNGCRYIVDITADQFGLPPVLVVDAIEDSGVWGAMEQKVHLRPKAYIACPDRSAIEQVGNFIGPLRRGVVQISQKSVKRVKFHCSGSSGPTIRSWQCALARSMDWTGI